MIFVSYENNYLKLTIDALTDSIKLKNIELIKKIPGYKYSKKDKCYTVPLLELKVLMRILKNNYKFVGDIDEIKNNFNNALKDFFFNIDLYNSTNFIKTLDTNKEYNFLKLKPKSYQKPAIEWISTPKGKYQIYGGLIADEVGLGKTIEAIGGVCNLKDKGICTSGIIICPASVKLQWVSEINKFTNETVRVINSGAKNKRIEDYKNFNETFLIISYELFKKDVDNIISLANENSNLDFSFIILDESHMIKNRERLAYQKVSLLNPKVKILLSATPAKRDISDIFTQFHYIDPNLFGSWDYFRVKFLNCIKIRGKIVPIGAKKEMLPLLNKMISPYMLRRKGSEVSDEIPELITYDIPIEATKEQKRWFKILEDDMNKELTSAREAFNNNNITYANMKANSAVSKFIAFSGCSDHLYLVKSSESKNIQSLVEKHSIKDLTSPKVNWLIDFIDNNIISTNEFIEDTIPEKIVIFTQFEKMARLLEDLIYKKFGKSKTVNPVLYTGKMKKDCQKLKISNCIDCFNCEFSQNCYSVEKSKFLFVNDKNVNVIICTDSAQAGVNLQVARYIVNFDLLYSPGDVEQRIGRIKRLNSEYKTVIAYNLYTLDSKDENIIESLRSRRESINKVVDDMDDNIVKPINTPNFIDKKEYLKI